LNEKSETEETSITLPFTREVLGELRAGDRLLLNGRLIAARDQAHRRIVEELDGGGDPPVPLVAETVFYAAPSPAPEGKPAGSMGPTTASRMDPYTPRLAEEGVSAFIGKGPRSPEVARALRENGSVYLVAVGGAAAVMGSRVKSLRTIALPELGVEAIYELQVENFPVLVALDLHGGDVFSHLGKWD
jgi:fumarate hydratase subunit beta